MRVFLGSDASLLEIKDAQRIPQTKQVNSIVSLSNRQSNYTNTFLIPKTAANIRTMKYLGIVGNNSRLPYEKTECSIQDEISGDWLIYKGWANVTETGNDYKLYVYDGIIDFYKAIENKSLTDVGLPDLNHIKNLVTVVASFTADLPYRYILADYNGRFLTTEFLNIDYLVPSAKISYIWDRIHSYAGFTYSGNIFNTEAFVNLFMTYPKPVPTEEPIVTDVTNQDSEIIITTVEYPNGSGFGGIFYGQNYTARILPQPFDTAEANNNNGYTTIEQTGSYRIRCSGFFTVTRPAGNTVSGIIKYKLTSAAGVIKAEGEIDGAINGEVILAADATDKLFLSAAIFGSSTPTGFYPMTGTMNTDIDLIVGYDANFEVALIDFQTKAFYDEIIQRLSLTPFKNKYTNHIEYLTLDEIIQNTAVKNWSNKNPSNRVEKYKIGTYGQKNSMMYRYNAENENHNDGYIFVDDKNLKDETPIIRSNFYSPEKEKTLNFMYFDYDTHIYKMWDKEVKDDGTVTYKDLSGRFYLLRSELKNYGEPVTFESIALNTSITSPVAQIESYYRLSFQDIIFDHYQSIDNILNTAKLVDLDLFLTPTDVAEFDFKCMIYLEQYSSYYLVDKIANYVSGKKTKCTLIEVDYFLESDLPVIAPGTFINISDVVIDGCDVTITFNSDYSLPQWFTINGSRELFGGIPNPLTDSYTQTLQVNENPFSITFSLPLGGFWSINITDGGGITSNNIPVNNFATCFPDPPPGPNLTYITITSVQTLSLVGNTRQVKINFITDWDFNGQLHMHAANAFFGGFQDQTYFPLGTPIDNVIINVPDNVFGNHLTWTVVLSVLTISSNTGTSV